MNNMNQVSDEVISSAESGGCLFPTNEPTSFASPSCDGTAEAKGEFRYLLFSDI